MLIEIQATTLSMSAEELKAMIPKEKLSQLKGGALQAYVVAQEGTSKPRVIGQGAKILQWPRAVIRQISEKLKSGTKFFINHAESNSHEGRTSVGEAIASSVKDLYGKMSAIVVGYFPEKDKVKDMDICSMETNVVTGGDNDSIVNDLEDISGVALGSSRETSPAFPGAIRLASVQCFQLKSIQADGGGEPPPGEGVKQMTFEEVKTAVKNMNIFPWQLFSEDEMRHDKVFGKVFEERDQNIKNLETTKKELQDTKEKSTEAIKASQKATAKTRLKELLPEGMTEKQKSFIMDNFNPDNVKDLEDAGLKGYVDGAQKEFTRMAKLFGVTEEANSAGTETKKDEGSGKPDISSDPVAVAMKELESK